MSTTARTDRRDTVIKSIIDSNGVTSLVAGILKKRRHLSASRCVLPSNNQGGYGVNASRARLVRKHHELMGRDCTEVAWFPGA